MMIRPSHRSAGAILILVCSLAAACQSTPANQSRATQQSIHDGLGAAARSKAMDAVQFALETLPSDTTQRWQVGDNTQSGYVTPLRTFRIETGHYCREYLETVSLNGEVRSRIETACRTQDGRWLTVKP